MVIYEGESVLEPGTQIVAVLTERSDNRKTGDIPQLWILLRDTHPVNAIRTGADVAVCGGCPLRGMAMGDRVTGRACYVRPEQAPAQVWKSYQEGKHPIVTPGQAAARVEGRVVRLGAYGDPAALPLPALLPFLKRCKILGYTHSWRQRPDLAGYVMASCETREAAEEASAMGFGTFLIAREVGKGEGLCPNVKTGIQCLTCKWCRAGSKRRVVVPPHGGLIAKKNAEALAA